MASKVIRFDRWPAEDRLAWQAAIAEGDIFDGRGPAAHWSAGSRRSIGSGYGRWIGYLITEEPDALSLAPAERVTRKRLRRYLDHLDGEISPAGVFNYVKHLYDAIRFLAPERDWAWLKALVWRLNRSVRPRSKAARLATPERLIELGRVLMAEFNPESPDLAAAIAYRDGLIIAFLAHRPIRRRNLAAIRIGRQLVRTGTRWHLLFGRQETKNHEPLEFSFPAELTSNLERYLTEVRSRFPNADGHDGLWASAKGCPMREDALYKAVLKRTKAAFGEGINLHFFRHIVATEIAQQRPTEVGMARDLLGHSDLRAVGRHYIQASQSAAADAYQAVLLALRSDSGDTRRKRRIGS
jgi:integrase